MSSTKTILRVNASSLSLSRCTLAWYRTIVQGYKSPVYGANLVYGIAGHKYIDAMFKSGGRIDLARDAALKAFNVPKYDNKKSMHLSDGNHFLASCYSLWENYIAKDTDFELVQINTKCWWCDGNKCTEPIDGTGGGFGPACEHCNGTGFRIQPATEVTFSILYYEDDDFQVFLEGTIDKIGKIKSGCYAIGDYKFTSSWDEEGYLDAYEMSSQLRFYTLAIKLMAEKYPDSILGKIGASRVGAFVDGIFLKSKACNNSYERSKVFQWTDDQMSEYRITLVFAIKKLMDAIKNSTWQHKEGILNGTCENKNKYSKCDYWFPCMAGKTEIEDILLKKNFIQKPYDPLHHNE